MMSTKRLVSIAIFVALMIVSVFLKSPWGQCFLPYKA